MPTTGEGRAPRGGSLSPADPLEPSGFRCAAASLDRNEVVTGSASVTSGYLLLEHLGPWGAEVLRHSRLPDGLGPELARRAAEARVKVLLIRRPARDAGDGHRVFAVSARPRSPWVETAVLDRPEQVLDLDLGGLREGRSTGLDRHAEPLFCVCTHGRHDACCAERGRPVAAALAKAYPEHTWEISHIGGDRFAANMLVAPDGLYYGRLTPESAVDVADAHLRGELALDHLRGRSGYAMPVQAAEVALRRHLGDRRREAWRVLSRTVEGEVTTVAFETGAAAYTVEVRSTRTEPVTLTCKSARREPAVRHEVLEIR